jgi:hypothetical protein
MAVLEDGVGGLPGVIEQLDVGAAAPKALRGECIEILCRVGDEVVLMLVVGVVWRGSSSRLASSFLLERPVSAPPIAHTASSLRLWLEVASSWLGGVGWALPVLYRFWPGFLLINRTTLFFLINRKGKAFASFQKKKVLE